MSSHMVECVFLVVVSGVAKEEKARPTQMSFDDTMENKTRVVHTVGSHSRFRHTLRIGKARQGKARQGKARQGRTRQDRARVVALRLVYYYYYYYYNNKYILSLSPSLCLHIYMYIWLVLPFLPPLDRAFSSLVVVLDADVGIAHIGVVGRLQQVAELGRHVLLLVVAMSARRTRDKQQEMEGSPPHLFSPAISLVSESDARGSPHWSEHSFGSQLLLLLA